MVCCRCCMFVYSRSPPLCLFLSPPVSSCLLVSLPVSFCLFLSPCVSLRLLLSLPVSFCLFMSSSVSFCLLLSLPVSFCLLLSPSVSFCLLLSLFVSFYLSMSPYVSVCLLSVCVDEVKRDKHKNKTQRRDKQNEVSPHTPQVVIRACRRLLLFFFLSSPQTAYIYIYMGCIGSFKRL